MLACCCKTKTHAVTTPQGSLPIAQHALSRTNAAIMVLFVCQIVPDRERADACFSCFFHVAILGPRL